MACVLNVPGLSYRVLGSHFKIVNHGKILPQYLKTIIHIPKNSNQPLWAFDSKLIIK